jgi:hypothetical protein
LLDLTPIMSATACHQRNYVERYSRYMPDDVCHLDTVGAVGYASGQ